jgi:hypothetical protein
MGRDVRRVIGLVAIYAIALNAILWGFSPPASTTSIDPFIVICHSAGADTAGDPQQQPASPAHSTACDHCTLCSALPASSPPSAASYIQFLPARLIDQLGLETAAPLNGLPPSPKLARGPPQPA